MSLPDWAARGRSGSKWTGAKRPPWAERTTEGQESVWDYPRPPRLEADSRRVIVRLSGVTVVDTTNAIRVLETASPPTFYLPPADADMELLRPAGGASRCEWKGTATYWSVHVPGAPTEERVGWSYPEPFDDFESIRGYLSFYPARLECTVAGERVRPQGGGFYGGWITSDVVGPFKGDPGAGAW